MVAGGWIYQKIYLLIKLYSTGTTNGRKMEYGKRYLEKYLFNPDSSREKKELPTLLLCDSQAVGNTDTGRNKGFCHYKNVNGIKRHTCVDTLGNILFVVCTAANVSDNQGLIQLLIQPRVISYFKAKTVNTKKITILLDNGYNKQVIQKAILLHYSSYLSKIRITITPKPTKDPNNPGFKPQHKRWVVERTNAWFEKCRILLKNCEKTLTSSVAKVLLCSIRLQVKQLAR